MRSSCSRLAAMLVNPDISSFVVPTTALAALSTLTIAHRLKRPPSVKMGNHVHQVHTLPPYKKLEQCLARGKKQPDTFIAWLHSHHQDLTPQEVVQLAVRAIDNAHAIELDALAEMYDEYLPDEFIIEQLLAAKKPHMFRELLQAYADGKIHRLQYLFDPENTEITIVEIDNKIAYQDAMSTIGNSKKIVVAADSERFDPSCVYFGKEGQSQNKNVRNGMSTLFASHSQHVNAQQPSAKVAFHHS
jgi:hypothetical protein